MIDIEERVETFKSFLYDDPDTLIPYSMARLMYWLDMQERINRTDLYFTDWESLKWDESEYNYEGYVIKLV